MVAFSWIVLLAAVLGGLYYSGLLTSPPPPPPVLADAWWGPQAGAKDDARSSPDIHKFTINVSDEALVDLKSRLARSRLKTDLEDPLSFQYGFRTSTMSAILKHWQEKYDWRKFEKKLNSFDQYKTMIEGISVHYLHVKPAIPLKSTVKSVPLLMVHGWPGSIWEFYKIIPLLTKSSTGGKAEKDEVVFELVVPSIPGYGFGEAPHRAGFHGTDAARVFLKLMKRLGHEKFYVQGGDWGSYIVTLLGQLYPQNVIGLHINMFPPTPSMKTNVKLAIGSVFPSFVGISELEYAQTYPLWEKFKDLLQESGYMHFHSTKPDTIGLVLNDSPVGLAAYILEKFSTWTDPTCRGKPDGCLLDKSFPLTLDEMLTNIMIYWLTESITSSVRFYKENFSSYGKWDSYPVDVPAGLASFPHELVTMPQSIAVEKYPRLLQFTHMPRGGHFAAFEEPQLLADDIHSFVKLVVANDAKNN